MLTNGALSVGVDVKSLLIYDAIYKGKIRVYFGVCCQVVSFLVLGTYLKKLYQYRNIIKTKRQTNHLYLILSKHFSQQIRQRKPRFDRRTISLALSTHHINSMAGKRLFQDLESDLENKSEKRFKSLPLFASYVFSVFLDFFILYCI